MNPEHLKIKSYQQLIDEALVRKPRERSGKWNPSSFGMCYRQQYWNRKDEPKSNPPDERSLRVFKAGEIFESFVTGLLPDGYELQVKVETDDVLGYADIVTDNEVADCKSMHSKAFWWMAKKDADVKKDKYHNWLQVMFYAIQLKKDFARLIFISKDDLCVKEYVESVNDYWKHEIEIELAEIRTWWKYKELPPAKPRCEQRKDGGYWMCDYCSWKDKCKGVKNGCNA